MQEQKRNTNGGYSMPDSFSGHIDAPALPARAPFAITPHDTNALVNVPKRLYVGTGGNVTLRGVDAASDVVYKNVGSGVYLNVRAAFVRATGTTASDIVAEA
jgi:hypothetical protein